tara:strand:- start:918 stop:1136 length:219 start_codon:yes stop_codon:yes gene_type:complete
MEIILLVIILACSVFNMLMLMDNNNWQAIYSDDTEEVLRSLREVTEDMQERLTILEESYKYHIQSTAEFNSK